MLRPGDYPCFVLNNISQKHALFCSLQNSKFPADNEKESLLFKTSNPKKFDSSIAFFLLCITGRGKCGVDIGTNGPVLVIRDILSNKNLKGLGGSMRFQYWRKRRAWMSGHSGTIHYNMVPITILYWQAGLYEDVRGGQNWLTTLWAFQCLFFFYQSRLTRHSGRRVVEH